MAFSITGLTAPAQTAPANPIPELNPADPTAGSPVAKLAPMSVDTVTSSAVTTNPNGYHEAIAKFSGGADATAHTASPTKPTATATATAQTVTAHAATTTHPPATKQTQVTSVSCTDHATKANQAVANRSLAAKVSTTAPPTPPSVRSTNDRVHAAQPHEQPDPLRRLSQIDIATTAAVSRASAIAQGALEFNPATAFATLAGGALLTGTEGTPVSREQATAIGDAENKQFGGETSDHVFSPYSNLQSDQAQPTQAQLDSRALARNELAPQPRAGAAPTSRGGVAADHPAVGTMLAARRDAQTLAPSMPVGVTAQDVNCNKPPKPEFEATREAFQGTYRNGFKDDPGGLHQARRYDQTARTSQPRIFSGADRLHGNEWQSAQRYGPKSGGSPPDADRVRWQKRF